MRSTKHLLISILPAETADLRLALQSPEEVTFGVVKVRTGTHGRDIKFIHRDLSTVRLYRANCLVDVLHRKVAFEAGHPCAIHRLSSFMHQTSNARVFLIAGMNQVKLWRSPSLETPAENLLVKC